MPEDMPHCITDKCAKSGRATTDLLWGFVDLVSIPINSDLIKIFECPATHRVRN